ncbi:MAG: pitrilysin family protein [Candidatus Binatia bacterium]|nr:pitrilysin family protein [Candidatus Binatia bacterium]
MSASATVRRFRYRGLRVVYESFPGPITAIVLSIRGGARFDGARPGLAHMAEHMLFQGTESFDQRELNRLAAECGGNHNAETGYESMELTFEVFNEDLDQALGLLAEQFYRTRIDPKRFAKERRVVLDEIRSYHDDPLDFLHERGWRAFYDDPIGRPICGTASSLRAMRPADIASFLRRFFVNTNAVLCVVGGSSEDDVRRSLRRHVLADRTGIAREGGGARGRRAGAMRVGGGPRGQGFVTRFLELDPSVENLLAVGVALDLVGADADGALFQAVREEHGLGYEVSADIEFGIGWGAAVLSASVRPGQTARLAQVMDRVLQESVEKGFDPADLARARKKRRYNHVSAGERRQDRAMALADAVVTGFPLPEEAERIVDQLDDETVIRSWRRAVAGRSLVAVLPG